MPGNRSRRSITGRTLHRLCDGKGTADVAGIEAALAAAEAGAETVLIDDQPLLGGALNYARFDSDDARAQEIGRERAAALLGDFPPYCRPRRLGLSLEPWSIENGLLTPTLKAKRAKVLERYADVVENLYRDNSPEQHDATV